MDDLFVKDIERRFGDSGYAFWFKTLELIGYHGDNGLLTISWSNYLEKLHKRRVQVDLMLDFCSTSGKLLATKKENELIIECKKFAEYSDNYTKYGKTLQSDFKDTSKQEEEVDKKKNRIDKKKIKEKNTVVFVIPEYLNNLDFKRTFDEFVLHRCEIKKPLTQRAGDMLLKKLCGYSCNVAIKMLEASIENGWQGVFELKGNGNGTGTRPAAEPGKYDKVVIRSTQ